MNRDTAVEKLFPVILPVPFEEYRKRTVPERVKFLSYYARLALMRSEQMAVDSWHPAEKPGDEHRLHLSDYIRENKELPKDEKGAPLPVNGCYWSVTHKPDYVGAVVSLHPAGMDIEKISPRSDGLWKKIADNAERSLIDSGLPESFFRYWTAKEAVLKAAGTGLTELSQCRIAQVPDENHLLLCYRNQDWYVEHFRVPGHIASVVINKNHAEWSVFRQWVKSVDSSPSPCPSLKGGDSVFLHCQRIWTTTRFSSQPADPLRNTTGL